VERRLSLAGEVQWCAASAATVRSRIARAILGLPASDKALGSITLHPHQLSAIARLEIAIDRFNGALLCDDVGMGKTFVAIAVARGFAHRLIVAPAALISMWRAALAATQIDAELVTFESLSRADSTRLGKIDRPATHDLVIVDEAHHVRNPRTNRYFALESLVRGAKVLLLSATPIHNHRDDLVALLSLFLGSRARAMTTAELASCVVRREQQQLAGSVQIPKVLPVDFHPVSDDPALVDQLMNLPPPVPLRDGGLAGALIGRGLIHQWASSEAALREALRRRVAKAAALCASLEAGTYPTTKELESWTYGEGALQLGFAELLSAPTMEHDELLIAIQAHLKGLELLLSRFSSTATVDSQRAQIIAHIQQRQPESTIVAFAQYAETVSMLFRRLAPKGRIAMLTSHGARVAGGPLTRKEAIDRFAPLATGSRNPSAAEAIDLLLTTDLLSEGVNLQDADTVIHLDIPWTAARMEQRVGRVARLGSPHTEVRVHAIHPPWSAQLVLGSESLIQRKWNVAKSTVGTSTPDPSFKPGFTLAVSTVDPKMESASAKTERLRAILENWITAEMSTDGYGIDDGSDCLTVSTVITSCPGFVAAVAVDGVSQLVVCEGDRVSTEMTAQIDACGNAGGGEITTIPADVDHAAEVIYRWFENGKASAAAGLNVSNASHRRAIIARIDATIETAPPHLRTARSTVAARARHVATASQCAAIERELESLLASGLPEDEWLHAIACLETNAGQVKKSPTGPLRIHAMLLLRNQD